MSLEKLPPEIHKMLLDRVVPAEIKLRNARFGGEIQKLDPPGDFTFLDQDRVYARI